MRKTLTAVVLALAVAGCTDTEKENEDPYPQEAKENFVDTCVEAAKKTSGGADEKVLRQNCQCTVDQLEDRLPYAREGANNDFKDADMAARDGRELTGDIQADFDSAIAECTGDR